MELIDISIVNVAIPSIQQELSASFSTIELVLAGYQLGFACVIITAARAGDIAGRKRLFLLGMTVFTASSLACGLAPTIVVLVAARVIQGIGSGMMFPQVLSTIQVVFPPETRGKAFAAFGAIVGLATIAGPLAGGALIAWNPWGTEWRSIFLVNVPLGLIAGAAAWRLVPESRSPERVDVDWVGTVLVTIGLFLLVFPLVQGRQYRWPWWIIAMLVTSALVLAAFAAYEVHRTRSPHSPLVVMTLFRQRAFSAGTAVALVFFAGLGAFFFTLTITLQVGFGYEPFEAGLAVVPFAIGAAAASGLSNVASDHLGTKVLNLGAAVLVGAMTWLMLIVRAHRTAIGAWTIAPALLLGGIGLGLVVAPLSDVILARVSGDETGSASGVLTAAQRVGGSVGIAIVGVIFFWQLTVAATPAIAAVHPRLRSDLRDAGLPPTAVHEVVAGFDACFHARAREPRAAEAPEECRRNAPAQLPDQVAGQVRHIVADQASTEATSRAFSRAFQRTLIYEIVVYLLVFSLAWLLPQRASSS